MAIALPSVGASVYFYSKPSDSNPVEYDAIEKENRSEKQMENIPLPTINKLPNDSNSDDRGVTPIKSKNTLSFTNSASENGYKDHNIPDNKIVVTVLSNLSLTKPSQSHDIQVPVFSYRRAFTLLWAHFKTSYSNKLIIMWSIWWAFATCGMYQVGRR